ncbi:MAG: hypothetical protein AAB268_06895 [Elusimicrobiota bacterium]
MSGSIRLAVAAVFLAVFASTHAPASPAASYSRLGDVFAEVGVRSPSCEAATLTKSLRREGRSHVFWTAVARLGRRIIRLEITTNMGPEAASRFIDERSVVVRALYKPATVDYFGVMSGRSDVPGELRPDVLYPEKSLFHSGNPAFIVWAKKDFDYAVRERAGAVYRGLLAFRYCALRRTLLQLEIFEPAAQFNREAALRAFTQLQCSGD